MSGHLSDRLHIPRGLTAVIGSGGKTTLLNVLSGELDGTVLLCTSTHILPFPLMPLYTGDSPAELSGLLKKHRVVCAGLPAAHSRKLTAPAIPFSCLITLADYVLVEADGSKHLPLKAHAPYEPVIPAETSQTVLVVGASGLGQPVADAVHRPEIFCQLSGLSPADIATPESVATVIRKERLADTVFINLSDTPEQQKNVRLLAAHLEKDSFLISTGSLCAKPPSAVIS